MLLLFSNGYSDEAVARSKELGDYSANPGLQQFFESYWAQHAVD